MLMIQWALTAGNFELAEVFLPRGRKLLGFAVGCPHLDVLKMVIEAGILRFDEAGAAETVELLVPHGRLDLMQRVFQLYSPPRPRRDGDVNWKSYWYPAIKAACARGDLVIVRWLIEHHYGREICRGNREDVEHDHFLCIAAEEGHVDVMQYLFDQGADDQYPDSLLRAVRKGQLNAVKWLLEHHLYTELWEGERVIEEAARNGRLEILKLLHGLDSSLIRPKTCSSNAMDDAAANGQLEVVKWLHANRSEGCTKSAMDVAASNGHLDVVQWLTFNTRVGCSTLAMDLAARNGHLDVLKWLRKNSSKGCTANAFENAIEHSHVRVACWLRKHFQFDVPKTMTIHPPNQFDMVLFLFSHFPETFENGNSARPRLVIVSGPNDEIVPR
ncbi:hypothetical protein PPTG_17799 [Phytophthora nicotianae INRA-310]|uniref:Uncharacterized protein n=1 Tax=Phytophthora nicotianae (strain INRA-310) TaxID=761204 RepID=W2PJZ4_PHYN3|nr:hypothetical protein PPTG_17799 [Phytophthora nicotianae INRA-310]ETN00574.1 hypothetical protein PPTG_17799 [Phytophthora nicotianae INRA-310]